MEVSYTSSLVALSVVIAIGASYVALDLTSRTAVAKGTLRFWWLVCGSFAMGAGIWCMHYVGMLAFQMGMPVLYDISTVLLSLVAAIAASLVALLVVTKDRLTASRAIGGAVVMGSGIATMHYVGMAAMRMQAEPLWNLRLVMLSWAIAIVVSLVALILASSLRGDLRHVTPKKLLAAAVMGVAIASMHYTGMAAATWQHDPHAIIAAHAVEITALGIGAIVSVTAIIFAFVFVVSIVDRQLSARSRDLRASEARYRQLFQRSLTGHYRSNRAGELLECNAAFARVFGYNTPDEALRRFMAEGYLESADRSAFLASLDATGSLEGVEREMRRADGTRVWILEHATLLVGQGGEPDIIEGSVIDITARKDADAALARAVAASDAANRAKSEFLANMSHEIRTPMNGIIGVAEILQRAQLAPEHHEMVDIIKLSGESLMDIINDVLDFSKIEAGRLELDPVEFDARELIEDSVRTLAPRAHLKELELNCDIAYDLRTRLFGDPGRVRQILLNLLGNALKFTTKGEVVVRAESHFDSTGAHLLHLSVRDTGIGIPVEKQAAIFEPFTQADASTTRRFGGTGLGLTITTHLTHLMDGRLTVESTPGVGSTFHAWLPLPVSEGPAAPESVAGLDDLRDLAVLIVDDNATNRHILEEAVSHWGLVPTVVEGGREALAALEQAAARQRPFNIVLLDFQMPEMDGFQVAEAIKARPGLADTMIMMLSSVGERGDGPRFRALGVQAFLTKPVRQSVLLEALLLVVGREKARIARGAPITREPPSTSGPRLVTKRSMREVARAEKTLRVLLAEDNPVNQLVAAKMLEARGHEVLIVPDGRQAVDVSARQAFDVILMDVQMPVLDGRAATAEIRRREAGGDRRTPIIAVTASAMEADRAECIAAGMDGYLSKPIQYDSFVAEVERCTAAVGNADTKP